MPDVMPALLAALVGGAWVICLWYLGVSEHPAVLSWRRLARLRGLADQRPVGERLGERLPLLRRAQEETDIGRLLAVAGRTDSAVAWLLRSVFLAGLALGVTLLLDQLSLVLAGRQAFPPALALGVAAGVALLAYLDLRRQATSRQRALTRAVDDSLPHMAVLTFHHRLPASEALLLFARCQRDPALHRLLSDVTWERQPVSDPAPAAVQPAARSTALVYEQIAQACGVPMFAALGSAVRRVTERGLSSQDVYTGLARATYSQRLADARVAAAQAKTLIVIPMGLMIVPVLVLIGAPLVASLAGIFAR